MPPKSPVFIHKYKHMLISNLIETFFQMSNCVFVWTKATNLKLIFMFYTKYRKAKEKRACLCVGGYIIIILLSQSLQMALSVYECDQNRHGVCKYHWTDNAHQLFVYTWPALCTNKRQPSVLSQRAWWWLTCSGAWSRAPESQWWRLIKTLPSDVKHD